MAEFLLYKGPHWMDLLSSVEVERRVAENPRWIDTYNRRYQTGDIVEVQPDGKWPNHNDKTPFYTIKVPGLSVEIVKKYMEPATDPTNSNRILRRRKWRVLVHSIPVAIKQKMLTGGVVTVSFDKVKDYFQDKFA